MVKKEIFLSILLVNFNTKRYLMDCLRSILYDLRDSKISFEINILDNNSEDNLSEIRDSLPEIENNGKINIYRSTTNLGFGGGHNLLAEGSAGKYLLLLNPDVVIKEKNSIKRLLRRIEKDSLIKVIGPRLFDSKGKTQLWDHGESCGFLAKFLNEIGFGICLKHKEETDCAWVSGAVFLIRKSTFEEIGGFDENFFLYKEEEDLCLRIRRQDRKSKILYYPEVSICHIGSVVAKKSKFFKKSYKYFLKKHTFGKRN